MTNKKAKLGGGIVPSRWSQQRMENVRETRISSQIIQMYGEFSLAMSYFRWILVVCLFAVPDHEVSNLMERVHDAFCR